MSLYMEHIVWAVAEPGNQWQSDRADIFVSKWAQQETGFHIQEWKKMYVQGGVVTDSAKKVLQMENSLLKSKSSS